VGLWYGSKETREDSDFDICRRQFVQIKGINGMPYIVLLYGSLLVFTFLFCLCICPAGLARWGDHWRNPHIYH
jgi:hypothetical protein